MNVCNPFPEVQRSPQRVVVGLWTLNRAQSCPLPKHMNIQGDLKGKEGLTRPTLGISKKLQTERGFLGALRGRKSRLEVQV